MEEIKIINQDWLQPQVKKLRRWAMSHYPQLALFNVFLVFMVLLRSAGYFDPFFGITINLIVFLSIIFAILFLGFGSRQTFFLAFSFWVLAAIFRIGGIEVWAERTALYTFQALLLGVVLLIIEEALTLEKAER